MSNNKQKEASRELQRRKARDVLIRRGEDGEALLLYIETIFNYFHKKKFRRTWWDPLLARALMDVYWGIIDRLIIEEPPRHGKTERAVRMFSSYAQGLDNTIKFQYSTYGADLSKIVSSETKEYMESRIYQEIFSNVVFSSMVNTKEHWVLKGNGGFQGTSVAGAATGLGSDIFILDDLHKATESHSKTKREEVWRFYNSSVLTRLEGRKAIIAIMQRLDADDFVGRVEAQDGLAENGGDWEKITLPVINDFESFDAFYNWIEKKGDDERKWVSDGDFVSIKEKTAARLLQDINSFNEKNPNAKENERLKFEKKRSKANFYTVAREVYLESHDLPSTVVRYRDMEVERPPLTPLDEEEYGLDFIVKQRGSMSLSEFKKQYMQDPEISEAGYFLKEHTREVMDADLPEQELTIIVDTAESLEAAADDRAIGVYGKSTDASKIVKTVLMDGRRGLWDVYGVCKQIIVLALRFPDAKILIEGAGGGITLGTVLKTQILIYNAEAQKNSKPQVSNGIFVFKPDNQTSKNQRIKLISAPREQGYFLVHSGCDTDFKAQFSRELLAFNPEKKTNTDNCIDTASLSYSRSECSIKMNLPPKPKPVERHSKRGNKTTWKGI